MIKGRAQVIGTGMVGGSVAAALRKQGWHVTGDDIDEARAQQAQRLQIIDAVGRDDEAEIVFVATPVSAIPDLARPVLETLETHAIVTDVGSVKRAIVESLPHPRFVGGHPMAGSECSGLEGVNADLFVGATWVLTPNEHTDPDVYVRVHQIVSSLGASVVTLAAAEHDEIVATISHVPHLVSSALMETALDRAQVHESVLRLAAGGFRDMTRIAAGHPGLWTDITLENREAIVEGIRRLVTSLEDLQELIANGNRAQLEKVLASAARGRRDLPLRPGRPAALSLLRVPIPDRPGALGEVLGIFGHHKVNVEDLQIAHDLKGDRGALELTVASGDVEVAQHALQEAGLPVAVEEL